MYVTIEVHLCKIHTDNLPSFSNSTQDVIKPNIVINPIGKYIGRNVNDNFVHVSLIYSMWEISPKYEEKYMF